jgi:DNA-binding CsgD family transcriptional regulator
MTLSQTRFKLVRAEPDKTESIEDLIRELVYQVQNANSTTGTDLSAPILSVDVDGFHYTLFRSHCAETCHLSPREKEIVRLVAEGLPNKCIGAVLEISCWTVATHVQRIFTKLGVTSRAAMVARLCDPSVAQMNPLSLTGSKITARPKIDTHGQGIPKHQALPADYPRANSEKEFCMRK